jgi:vancomycin resistance protein YoaR
MARALDDLAAAVPPAAGDRRHLIIDVPKAALLGAVTALVIAAVGTYLFATNYYGRVVPGVRVDGVSIGGLPPESASSVLVARAQQMDQTRVTVRADDQTWQPTLGELGVSVDPSSTASRAYEVGRVGSPIERSLAIASALVHPVDLVAPSLDRDKLVAWVNATASQFDRPVQDANLAVSPSGEVRLSPESPGRQLDRGLAVAALGAAVDDWLAKPGSPPPTVDLPFTEQQPAVRAADLARPKAQAKAALARPLVLKLGADSWRLDRADLGRLLTFRPEVGTIALDVDPTALGALVDRIASVADRRPTNASLSIGADAKVTFTPDVPGRQVDRQAAAEQIKAALLNPTGGELRLPAAALPATVRAGDLASARQSAERVLGGPTRLVAGDQSVTLQPTDVAPMLRVVVGSGPGRVEVDETKLRPVIEQLASDAERTARNPRLRLVGGSGARPGWLVASMPNGGEGSTLETIEAGAPGQHVDVAKALDAAKKGLLASSDRTVSLPVDSVQPFDAAGGAAFGPLEFIDGSTTSYAGSIPERAHNIELAASRLNGVVVPPHATFDFNRELGSTSVGNGYQWAWGFAGGPNGATTVPSVGGGICQVATTLFQGVFWAGYQIEERNWHMFAMPRYSVPPRGMPGLDATVDEESGVDLKWTNNTDSPILIQARTDGANISFGLYGQKPGWDVTVEGPVVDQVRPSSHKTIIQYEPTLPAGYRLDVEDAHDGYRSTIVRTVTAPGQEPRTLRLVSIYEPSDNIIAVGTGGRR